MPPSPSLLPPPSLPRLFIQELLNVRDGLERQLQELTQQLSREEEQRISALKETEEARVALIGADRHCSEMETRNKILEGQVCRLWGGWSRKGEGHFGRWK